MKRFRLFALGVLLSALTGCATLDTAQTPPGHPLSAQQLTQLKAWQALGQFAFEDKQSQQGVSARLVWQQHVPHTNLQVFGPLGLWHASLSDDTGQAVLAISDGRIFQADSFEALMRDHLTWYLPVTSLQYWLFALPQPNQPVHVERDGAGAVVSLQQAGWRITYCQYQTVNGLLLPKRLRLEQGAIRLTVVIQQWQLTF